MDNLLIDRRKMRAEARSKIERGDAGAIDLIDFSRPVLGKGFASLSQVERFDRISRMTSADLIQSNVAPKFRYTAKYGGGFHVPMKWADGTTMSVYDRIRSGKMSSNTLPVDWQNLWDALRLDVSVRKAARGTIRESIYNVTRNPNFTRTIKPTEVSPFGVVFEEVTGHGDAIPQGETLGGGYDSFNILVYAAGFTWDLIAELFDMTITPERLADAVMVGEDALKDDLAISPILNFSYSGVQQTAASTVGTLRQELLYNTLVDGLDDLGNRNHPVTDRKLDVMDVVILAHPFDARHIAQVSRGLPSSNERAYPALSEISQVISYDDEIIRLRDRTVTYSGVSQGTAYMCIPARALEQGYMEIAVKRDTTVEVDTQPDVKTLAREERAYWFAEGIWYEGIQYFVQELTLPTW